MAREEDLGCIPRKPHPEISLTSYTISVFALLDGKMNLHARSSDPAAAHSATS